LGKISGSFGSFTLRKDNGKSSHCLINYKIDGYIMPVVSKILSTGKVGELP